MKQEYIDLGLPSGTLWATCNIGANKPEEYGDYFAWGETWHKSTYSIDNSRTYGLQLNDISGNPLHDAARTSWGNSWRIPTLKEFQELVDECLWEWTKHNGIMVYNVMGPNGNSIFLPAAGCRYGSSLFYAGEIGFYWSSTPDSNGNYACDFCFNSSLYYVSHYGNRYRGLSIRPVKTK